MLGRQMFGYAPSLIVPAIASFASVTFFTWQLSPEQYGQYVLAINAMSMLVGCCFYWLQSTASRLMPEAVREGRNAELFATLYSAFAVCGVVLLLLAAALAFALPLGDWKIAVWFAPPLAVLRSLLNLNQAGHRNFLRIMRYNLIEMGQAIVGLGSAVMLVAVAHQGASGAAMGMMLGLAAMSLFDWRMLARVDFRKFDRRIFTEVLHFGLPFVVTNTLSFALSRSDSFLIQYFRGAAEVGVYGAGYAYPDRIGQYLFMAVATASFPLTVRRLEQEGVEAARDQTYANGVAILALAVPACAGLLLINRHLAAVLIGGAFQEGALRVMPWIAVATILNGIASHYFDHAFLLAKKTRLFFFTLGPAALLNFLGNLYAIPRYGYMGAAYTTLAAYAVYLLLSIVIGRRVFRIKFPFRPALHILVSTLIMASILYGFSFPETVTGLIKMIVIGGAVYTLGVMMFDIMGARSFILARFAGNRRDKEYMTVGLDFSVVSSSEQVAALMPEWQALYGRVGSPVFGSPDWYQVWWTHLGEKGGVRPHFVTARKDRQLVALLPLVVRRAGLFRFLEWAGYDVFDYGDALAETPCGAEAVWRHALAGGGYDIALIKDVRDAAASLPVLNATMRGRGTRRNYFLPLAGFGTGEAWLAGQSRKLRGDTRRKMEKMQAQGGGTGGIVAFHALKDGEPVPDAVLETLYRQKAAWFTARKASGVFADEGVRPFLQAISADAAAQGRLYLAWLSCGDAVVACHMGFVRDGALYLYHTTYDADYGAFSPGNIMMVETIKWAVDNDLAELDFMRGDETYKQRFAGGSRGLAAFVAAGSLWGRVAILLNAARDAAGVLPEDGKEESQNDQ
jgi:CelD/BcsL family acetyltransferase involved in cellulose biosynthesis/O-antigen/teichoic acid export membrane protein